MKGQENLSHAIHDGSPADLGFRDSGIRNEDATLYCPKWTQNKTSRTGTDLPRERFPASARTAGSGESVVAILRYLEVGSN